jgi:adenylate cyclase, class 2
MKGFNVEIKARCADPSRVRKILRERGASFKGVDRQIDTYFHVKKGRLKIRQGAIENCVVHYERENKKGPKGAKILLYPLDHGGAAALKPVLAAALGVRAVVEKRREIYFIGNVKFHIDRVKGLGSFVELEAMDKGGRYGRAELRNQAARYLKILGIEQKDLLAKSYSDMRPRLRPERDAG